MPGARDGALALVPPSAGLWSAVLRRIPRHDFYHTPAYHRLAEERGEGAAWAAIYRDGPYGVLLPLLLRPVAEVPGLEREPVWDATSVHGYPGPVATHERLPDAVRAGLALALRDALLERDVVCVFSRLHPLLRQDELLDGHGEVMALGRTVSLDLRLTGREQWARYRENHRRDILRLRRSGAVVVHDHDWARIETFAALHRETLERVRAKDSYALDLADFVRLRAELGTVMHLFLCERHGEPLCGGLFSLYGDLVQYHLGATHSAALKLAPMKLLFEEVREWARGHGARHFHLGGGVGAREDGLYNFKRGFSERTHPFRVWRWVLDRRRFHDLCAATRRRAVERDGFFPPYRARPG